MSDPQYSFSPKDPGETEVFTFDFVNWLNGDSITGTPTMTCAVKTGTDPDAADMISGGAIIQGTKISQLIRDGLDGNEYEITCTFSTDGGQTLKGAALLPVETRT